MATIKIGDKVTIKNTGKEVVIENIYFCHYYVTGESAPFTASDLIRVKDKSKKNKMIKINKKFDNFSDDKKDELIRNSKGVIYPQTWMTRQEMIDWYKNLNNPTLKELIKDKKKPIKKTSNKRAKQLRAYKVLSKKWHEDNKTCKNCGATGEMELHHQKGKENELLLDTTQWISLCNDCHREATDKSKEAIEKGISISRHKKQ